MAPCWQPDRDPFTSPMASSTPPEWELHSPPTAAHFRRLYDKHQLVLIRGALSPSSADGWWAEPEVQLRKAFDAAPKMVAGTWTCENGTKRDAVEVLGRPAPRKRRRSEATTFAEDERWYASFVVQPSGGSGSKVRLLFPPKLGSVSRADGGRRRGPRRGARHCWTCGKVEYLSESIAI